jgi:hypothetical protein
MRFRLNPQLVRYTVYRDPDFPFHEQAVFLRDPHVIPDGYEPGIGEVLLDDVREDVGLAAEWNEVGALMADSEHERVRIFRSRGCFGFSPEEEVLLIINSSTPPVQPEPKGPNV